MGNGCENYCILIKNIPFRGGAKRSEQPSDICKKKTEKSVLLESY